MTTERSGMSLERVRNDIIAFYTWEKDDSITEMCKMWVAAIDAHLSRDAVVSFPDLPLPHDFVHDGTALGEYEDVYSAQQMREYARSFAARHVAIPNEIDHFFAPEDDLSSYSDRDYAQGWNACRKAMLAQRDGGTK